MQQAPIHRPIQHSTWLSAPLPVDPKLRAGLPKRGWGCCGRGNLPPIPWVAPEASNCKILRRPAGWLLPVRCCHRPPLLRKGLLGPTAIDRSIQRPIHLATQLSARP